MTERDLYLQKDCTRMLSTVLVSTSCTGKDTDLLLPPNGMQDMPNQLQEADNWSRRVPQEGCEPAMESEPNREYACETCDVEVRKLE
jgi:hypothetical protein